MSTQTKPPQLTTRHLVILLITAAAPLAVLSGGVSSAMRASSVLGIAVLFLVLALLLMAFVGAYGALSRNIAHSGGFYPYIAKVFGPSLGLGAASVALLGYSAMAVGLQGLLGSVFVKTLKAETGVSLPWWVPVVVALLAIGGLGALSIRWSVWVCGVLLTLELAAVLVFDSSALASPGAQGISFAAFNPSSLLSGAVAVAASFAFTAWIGVETGSTYSAELGRPRRMIFLASAVSVGALGLIYTLSSWALTVAAGPSQVVAGAKEQGTNQVPALVADRLGTGFANTFNAVLVVSLFAAALCFHNVSARQFGALARDGVLPAALGRRARSGGAPVVASLVQAGIGIVVVVAFELAQADPVTELFAWLTNIAATCVLLLLVLVSLATIVFLLRSDFEEASFLGWEGPVVGAFFALITFGALFVLSITQFSQLIDVPAGSPQAWFLPALVPMLFLGGILTGRLFQLTRPEIMSTFGLASVNTNALVMDALSPATAEPAESEEPSFLDDFPEIPAASMPAWATQGPEWPREQYAPVWTPSQPQDGH